MEDAAKARGRNAFANVVLEHPEGLLDCIRRFRLPLSEGIWFSQVLFRGFDGLGFLGLGLLSRVSRFRFIV